ncbi:hypothetical protein N7524_011819 [Penicillium chrysogenum]|nr:hypothetical protein N7524_011819 [Penicillium chrysogenum]
MLSSLEAAKEKLKKYYSDTDDIEGNPYAIGIILAPSSKIEFFSTSDWDLDPKIGRDYRSEYRESLYITSLPNISRVRKFPILASVARDIMSIPATSARVKRLFNSARDICHYRRGSLNLETIRDIMLYICITRFDIKEE